MACNDTYTSLTFTDSELDPDAISTRMNLAPTVSHRRGEVLKGDQRWQRGFWNLSTEFMESLDFAEHLDSLLDAIAPRAAVIRELVAEGIEVELHGYWSADDGFVSFELSPKQIDRLQLIGVGMSIVTYYDHPGRETTELT